MDKNFLSDIKTFLVTVVIITLAILSLVFFMLYVNAKIECRELRARLEVLDPNYIKTGIINADSPEEALEILHNQ